MGGIRGFLKGYASYSSDISSSRTNTAWGMIIMTYIIIMETFGYSFPEAAYWAVVTIILGSNATKIVGERGRSRMRHESYEQQNTEDDVTTDNDKSDGRF